MSRHSSGRGRRAMRRLLIVGCVVLTVSTGLVAWCAPGTYLGSVDAIFLSPSGVNVLAENDLSVSDSAGIVARSVDGVAPPLRPVGNDVSMVDEGILGGYTVRQPQSGGQWGVHFDQNVLRVESAGRTEDEARASMADGLSAVRVALAQLQEEVGVPVTQRIRVQLSPSHPRITYRSGSRVRAVLGIAVLGGLMCVVAIRVSELGEPVTPTSRTARVRRR